jgi:tight adherence protein C
MSSQAILLALQAALPLLAALSVFSATLVVAWPYFARDKLAERLEQVANERERIRIRERRRLEGRTGVPALRNEPKRVYKEIVSRFKLASGDNGELAHRLRMAGYRGPGPITTFLAAQFISCVVLFLVGLLYIFVVIKLPYPAIMKLAMAIVVGYLGYYAPLLYIKNKITKRQHSIRRAWPDALDLMLICVESGMSIENAFRKVSEEVGVQSPDLAEELSLTTAELSYLQGSSEGLRESG